MGVGSVDFGGQGEHYWPLRAGLRLELINAEVRHQVDEPGKPISAVYFPISAVFSMVGAVDGHAVEVATIGREGMVGLPVFLGRSASPHASFCQIAGRAACMPAQELPLALPTTVNCTAC